MNDSTKSTAVMTATPLRQVKDVKELLFNENAKQQLAMVAAKHMNPERMMRVVANAIRATPKLQQCDPMSFLGALMHCASLGLEPNTPLGHAYLIPFENKRKGITEVQVVIGYKGFIDLSRRTGQLANIHADVVYSDDELWSHEYGSNQHLRHRPGPRKGKIVAFYCHVELKLGEDMVARGHRVMSYDEVIRHRNQHSQGWKTAVKFGKQKDSPWFEGSPTFEAMGAKTVVRAMASRGELPMSIEFMEALDADEQKVDYRAFAMDPTNLPAPQPDDNDQDGDEPMIEGEVAKEEAKPAKSALDVGKENAARDAEKAKAEDPKKDAPAKEEAKPEPDQAKPTVQISEAMQKQVDTIRADLLDAGPGNVNALMEMYAPLLGDIETFAPEIYAEIKAEAEAMKAKTLKGEE